jgi:hypothetical protein
MMTMMVLRFMLTLSRASFAALCFVDFDWLFYVQHW